MKKRERAEEPEEDEDEEEEKEEKKEVGKNVEDESALKRLKVAELRERCAKLGLSQDGIKAVLIERILKKK